MRDQLSLHGLLGDQAHRPARQSHGRITAHHGDDPLFFRRIQKLLRPPSTTLIESLLQSALLVSMGDPPNGLGRQVDDFGDHRSGLSHRQLLQGNRPEHNPNLLNASAKDLPNDLLIAARQMKVDGAS